MLLVKQNMSRGSVVPHMAHFDRDAVALARIEIGARMQRFLARSR
jgi:hypothetical protein